jgi:hypothetical protein
MKNRIAAATFILFAPLLLSIPAGSAYAGQTCHSDLANGFYDEYRSVSAPLRDRAMYAELCGLDFQQAQNAIKRAQKLGKDKGLGLSYGLVNLDDFPPDTGANSGASPADELSEDRFNQWKSGYCVQNATLDPSQAAEFFMQGAAAGNTGARSREAWSACMRKRGGLTCWATPVAASAAASTAEQGEEFLLNINWTSSGTSQPQAQPEVQYSYLTRGGVAKFEGVAARRILPAGYKLKTGTQQIAVAKPADKGVFASLKVNHAGTEHSCKVFIPGDKDFPLSEPFVNRLKIKYPG